jgi:hypothetical protein
MLIFENGLLLKGFRLLNPKNQEGKRSLKIRINIKFWKAYHEFLCSIVDVAQDLFLI